MSTNESGGRIPILLTREEWNAVKMALIYTGNQWRFAVKTPSRQQVVERIDDSHDAIAAQLKEQTDEQ